MLATFPHSCLEILFHNVSVCLCTCARVRAYLCLRPLILLAGHADEIKELDRGEEELEGIKKVLRRVLLSVQGTPTK